jgi:hypothetical protein
MVKDGKSIQVKKLQDLKGYICGDCSTPEKPSQNIILAKLILKEYNFGAKIYSPPIRICNDCYSDNLHKHCVECFSTEFSIDEDYEIKCAKCGLVHAKSIPYVAGEKIDLPWGVLLKRTKGF